MIGARKFLIAYNINLNTSNVGLAKAIARKIRASSGGFPCVKAMGVGLKARNLAQVSMSLTDFETTSVATVFDAVAREAAVQGVGIEGSEIVGLIPRRALEDAAVQYLKVEDYKPTLIFENRLAQIITEQTSAQPAPNLTPLRALAEGFVAAVAAPTATPGGGSVAALAGALAASLGEMVCGLTLKRKSFEAHHAVVRGSCAGLAELRERLLAQIDRDAQSYEIVMGALKLPKATEAEQAMRAKALDAASKTAASVPLETAQLAAEVARLVEPLRPITIPQAASDLAVALSLAAAAQRGALENVLINLPEIRDPAWVTEIRWKAASLEMPSPSSGS